MCKLTRRPVHRQIGDGGAAMGKKTKLTQDILCPVHDGAVSSTTTDDDTKIATIYDFPRPPLHLLELLSTTDENSKIWKYYRGL